MDEFIYYYDCVVVEHGKRQILFEGALDECQFFIDNDSSDRKLVILYGDEDAPKEWE